MVARIARLLPVLLLLAPLVLPQLLGLAGVSEGPKAEEKRLKAQAPSFSLFFQSPGAFGKQMASYYADNFPFRDWLIRQNNELRLAIFRQSPVKGVIIGTEGWLFFNMESDLEDWLDLWAVSDEELDMAQRTLTQRRDWLKAQGIEFMVVIAPNKTTIYSEFLPAKYHKLGRVSRLDRLAGRLKQAGIAFVDLRPAMLAAKTEHQAYWKTDTHWNDWGALTGCAAIVDALRPAFPNMARVNTADYQPVIEKRPGGDLAALMLMENTLGEDYLAMRPRFTPKAQPGPSKGYANPTTYSGRDMVIRQTGNPKLPNALVFRDSFSSAAIPYLAEHFNRSVYIWVHQFHPEIVLAEKPDVVILEAVERYQHAVMLDNPPLPRVAPDKP